MVFVHFWNTFSIWSSKWSLWLSSWLPSYTFSILCSKLASRLSLSSILSSFISLFLFFYTCSRVTFCVRLVRIRFLRFFASSNFSKLSTFSPLVRSISSVLISRSFSHCYSLDLDHLLEVVKKLGYYKFNTAYLCLWYLLLLEFSWWFNTLSFFC